MNSKYSSRLILSDWAASENAIPQNRQRILEELLVLSLVFDEILIQDDILALNMNLANMFAPQNYFNILEQLIESGALVILSHPLYLYPDDDIKDRAKVSPIFSRAEYIKRYGTAGDKVFNPTDKQLHFYKCIDECLKKKSKFKSVCER